MPPKAMDVYVEQGAKRAIALAVEWPGWARVAKTEAEALDHLMAYAPRYAKIAGPLGFVAPSSLRVVTRIRGGSSTDFGTPGEKPTFDEAPVTERDLTRLIAFVDAAWKAFDAGVRKAKGKTMRAGPRGGGRTLAKIVAHVQEAELVYVGGLGAPTKDVDASDAKRMRKVVHDALAASARGEFPAKGPRGGVRWKPRYFVRRDVWHILDHLWEIEDRS